MTPKQRALLEDVEAAVIGAIAAYEALAIGLRKTRWTNRFPPLTRKITKNELLEEAILLAFKHHFIRYRHSAGTR